MQSINSKYNPAGREPSDPPSSEAFDATAARAAHPQKRMASAAPRPPQMALSSSVSGAQVQALREAFETALTQVAFQWTKNNVTTTMRFTNDEIESVTSIIFNEVFNVNGYQCALNVVNSHRESVEGSNPVSATLLAARLALDDHLPVGMRKFYSGYSASTRSSTKLTAVERMLTYHEKYVMYQSYLELLDPSDDLQTLLQEAGFVPKQGQGWTTVMQRYLSRELGLPKGKLSNILQETQCVYLMVTTFGVGVLVLVPRNIINL